eukprot:TRINITY_DN2187_c0_g1_i1.p1 TRINITY_DN2187_c0_g1~~TRINITY_DN2187_c0_g1_i1.p1  ORF type:complete len:128 (+),score=23.00 TRINITY_DN2187_c0_g1_i1:104-487(+)
MICFGVKPTPVHTPVRITLSQALVAYRDEFYVFLKSEHAENYLLCVERIKQYKENATTDKARQIVCDYLQPPPNSGKQALIYVPPKILTHVVNAVEQDEVEMNLFDDVENNLYDIIDLDFLQRFQPK